MKLVMRTCMLVGALLFGLSVLAPIKTNALSGSDFKPGRIIDDVVFTNKNSMSVAQIQQFLNAKVQNCEIFHSAYNALNPPPYTCLKDYQENTTTGANNFGQFSGSTPVSIAGGKSAAQIIWEASQQYNINPQVMIVLLQKEQGLVTDTWPLLSQFTKATGYLCPDTAACNSNAGGFSKQVFGAAWQFRNDLNGIDTPGFFSVYGKGLNNIRLSPNAACGTKSVNIENQATAVLYKYTPYTPNDAALANLNGIGDGCSAYGNRNFWRYYNDWFGSTQLQKFASQFSTETIYARSACSIPTFAPNLVVRLYNPDTKDYLYTKSRIEACQSIVYGYIFDGIVFSDVGVDAPDSRPVFRLSNYSRHLYTTDEQAKNLYTNSYGYNDEGIVFYGFAIQKENTVPVFHLGDGITTVFTQYSGERTLFENFYKLTTYGIALYTPLANGSTSASQNTATSVEVKRLNSVSRGRLFTLNPDELQSAANFGFREEVGNFNATVNQVDQLLPIYRLRSPQGNYLYTNSRNERDIAVINFAYSSEGTSFYGKLSPSADGKSVYRLVSRINGNRLFTTSEVEKNMAVSLYGYTYEGVGWFDK